MGVFSKVFKSKDSAAKKQAKTNGTTPQQAPQKPRWDDAWQRTDVEPEEVQELLRGCTTEIKSRSLDLPFLLLPFRPASDPSAARTFVRNYFGNGIETTKKLQGEDLSQELRLVEPLVLCSVMKWCWSRLSGGVVTWEAYELFKIGEQDSNTARDAFATFIPISVASDARTKIIFDFFELLASIAAHGKTNGLGGVKLSRYAGWWAFEHPYSGTGFDAGYKTWQSAAHATSHLFFAYLRSLSPDSVEGKNGISALPRSLQHLLTTTEYPPDPPAESRTSKIVMVVDTVSPTPFSLLRRAKNFEYRDEDPILQRFSNYEDPIDALTDECKRVLRSISSANDSSTSKASTSLKDPSWSRFEDIGFSGIGEDDEEESTLNMTGLGKKRQQMTTFGPSARSKTTNGNRPTTPSWADFLSSGFVDDGKQGGHSLLLPPDKILPPINTRGQSSQSHKRLAADASNLEPGELANVTSFNLDDTFWWVWITSLAGEESLARKAVFGRCALIETRIHRSSWIVVEELLKGAAPEPDAGAYVAEKKSRFGFSSRNKLSRSKSSIKGNLLKNDAPNRAPVSASTSKTSFAPDQHARIQAAAAALQQKHQREEEETSPRRARQGVEPTKTNSVLTLQPVIMKEAAPAMKWASSYDKNAIRAKYLGNDFAGRGSATDLPSAITPVREESGKAGSAAPPSPSPAPIHPAEAPVPEAPLPPAKIAPIEPASEPSAMSRFRGAISGSKTPEVKAPEALAQAVAQPLPPTPANEHKILERTAYLAHELPSKDNKENTAPAAPSPLSPAAEQQYPRPMERQAGPPVQDVKSTTPNILPATPEPAQAASNGDTVAAPPSPDAGKSDKSKLKKKHGPSGFKNMFGRKKNEESPKNASPPKPSSGNSSAVAAARAALEAKAAQSQGTSPTPQSKVTNKRFSTIGNKLVPEPSSGPMRQASVAPLSAPVERPESTVDHSQYEESYASTVDPNEARQAEHEFSTFDQGPLEDNPSFIPEDSPRESTVPDRKQPTTSEEAPIHAAPNAPEPEHSEDVPEPSQDLAVPVNDRWAQIRKNAADRAARMSEEQSRQTDKTDDGDSSEGESMDARVARIKARVAELTGNMDSHGAARAHP